MEHSCIACGVGKLLSCAVITNVLAMFPQEVAPKHAPHTINLMGDLVFGQHGRHALRECRSSITQLLLSVAQ